GESANGVRLLPYFDAYVVACQPRSRLFPGAAAKRALSPTGQAGHFPVLLIDGVVAGVWHLRRSGRKGHLTVEPLRRLTATELRDLEGQADRVGSSLAVNVDLTIGTVEVGPHA